MYNKVNAQFANVADINTQHYLVFPEIQPVMRDILQRDTIFRKRIQVRPVGLEFIRWVEQTKMAQNAGFSDPRVINPAVTDYAERVERMAKIKAITSRITYGLFDSELTRNGTFSYVLEKDMKDGITDMLLVSNNAMWTGSDTSYGAPTTLQYFGVLNAITNTGTVAAGVTMAQAIKSKIAEMAARTDVTAFPSAIYMNPLTQDELEKEENAQKDKTKFYDVEVIPGTIVKGIMTAVGILPIITDNRIPVTDGGTNMIHKIVLLDESKVVRYGFRTADVDYSQPVVFKLGTTANLNTDYIMCMFDAPVVEYADKAHCILTKSIVK